MPLMTNGQILRDRLATQAENTQPICANSHLDLGETLPAAANKR